MLQIRREKLDQLVEEGRDPHIIENFKDRTLSKEILDHFEDWEGKNVRVAGRIMAKRGHGKVVFMDLQDSSGKIQLFNQIDEIGQEEFEYLKDLDIGDIIGAEGTVFKTQRGEISVKPHNFQLLTKSLQILPEKYHGLRDIDLRYRQRYVDLIVNPEIKETFIKRTKIVSEIRRFLDEKEFLEVETPILSTIAGGASAKPFITHHNSLDLDMYLRIANELYLKRLIVGGFDKVYEMGRMFRNEGMSPRHNPEYTMIELYQAYGDVEDMMDIMENMVASIAKNVLGTDEVEYKGKTIDLTAPWRRVTMVDIVKEYANIDFEDYLTDEEARDLAREHNIKIQEDTTRGEIIELFFDEYAEEHLIQPTFVTQHPVEISPLAKKNAEDPRYTQRFEAFISGYEIANAYSELNDARDQKKRFEEQESQRKGGDEEAQMMDRDFVNALEVGMPPTGGLGIGVDRLVMILTGEESIRDVLLFPTMKPLEDEGPVTIPTEKQEIESVELDLSKVKIEPLFEDFVDFDTFCENDFRVVKVKNCEDIPKSRNLLKFTLDDGSGTDRIILSGIKDYYKPEELIGKTLMAITNLPERKMMGKPSQGMLLSAVCEYDGEEHLNLIILDSNIPAGAKIV